MRQSNDNIFRIDNYSIRGGESPQDEMMVLRGVDLTGGTVEVAVPFKPGSKCVYLVLKEATVVDDGGVAKVTLDPENDPERAVAIFAKAAALHTQFTTL